MTEIEKNERIGFEVMRELQKEVYDSDDGNYNVPDSGCCMNYDEIEFDLNVKDMKTISRYFIFSNLLNGKDA